MLASFLALILMSCMPKAVDVPEANYKLVPLSDYGIAIQDYVFPSGLRILFQEEKTQPIVAITSVLDRGSEADQKGRDGIAHVLEHLAFRAKHSKIKNWDYIKQLGGTINASTSVDWTNYMTIAPRDALVPLLRIEAWRMKDVVKNVTEQDVRTECEIARNELRMRYENAAVGAAWDVIGDGLFPDGHPYSRSTIGSHETLSAIDLASVQEFGRDNYRPEHTTIVVAGDFDLRESGNLILESFKGNEDLLMSPEDAKKYKAIKSEKARRSFYVKWQNDTLVPYLKKGVKLAPRVDCSKRTPPPEPNQKLGPKDKLPVVKGMTDSTNVIVAWSLPGGYCSDTPVMQMSAYMLSSYITQHLWTNGEDQEANANNIGCFASPDEYATQVICFVDKKARGLSGLSNERVFEKVKDALYLQWQRYDPNMVNTMLRKFYQGAQMSQMNSMLQSADSVSNLFSGRATTAAMYTHFTGDPLYFSTNMSRLSQVTDEAVKQMAMKYLTRDRAVGAVVEPMDQEERIRREQEAGKSSRSSEVKEYHASQDSDRYSSLFPKEKINEKLLKEQFIAPDLTKLKRFTMDNGLEVAILPYGEVPLVRTSLRLKGDPSNIEPIPGLNSLSDYDVFTGKGSKEAMLAVAGYENYTSSSASTGAASGNLDAALNKLRWRVEDQRSRGFFKRRSKINSYVSSVKSSSKKPENWSNRVMMQTVFPDNVMGTWMRPDDYEKLRELKAEDLLAWHYKKWQPANAELILVGKLDVAKAKELVDKYFASWSYKGTESPESLGYMKKASKQSNRSVFLFDKPTATQTQVSMMCQIDANHHLYDKPTTSVVSDVLSEMAWRTLREEAGVTYGAYAYDQIFKGGSAIMGMQSLVQNDSAGFAVEKMLEIVDKGYKGDVSKQSIADAKIKIAREFVLGQQSGAQMLGRLAGIGIDHFDYFNKLPTVLASVNTSTFTQVLEPCKGHEVFTIVGPLENTQKQLKDKKIPFEVYDWEGEYKKLLTPKEIENYEKAKKAKAEREAKKKSEVVK